MKLIEDNPEFKTSKQLLYQSKLSEGIIFNGDFYPKKAIRQAKKDLKSLILRNPEQFATITYFSYNSNSLKLSKEITNDNDNILEYGFFNKEKFIEEILANSHLKV